MSFSKQKKLGQVFLKDQSFVNKIIKAGQINEKDLVLEIGAGKGILTQALLKTKAQVIAIEKDPELVKFLKKRFENNSNLKIIQGDIRDFLISDSQILKSNFKVIGNIPYYLTSHLIKLLLELEKQPEDIILMIQKEVAQRIIQKPSKMNLLAVSVQFYAHAKIISYVPKTAFSPKPKIDSAIIKITPFVDNKRIKTIEQSFFKIIKAGFKQPRKLLINNLCLNLKIDKKIIEKSFKKLDLPLNIRAQNLSLDQWTCLSLLLINNKL